MRLKLPSNKMGGTNNPPLFPEIGEANMNNQPDIISIQFTGSCPNCNQVIKHVPIVNHRSDMDSWIMDVQCPICSFEFERAIIK